MGNFDGETLSARKINIICTENGWLKEQDQKFFYNGIRAMEKRRTKCISVARNYVEKRQNMMYISCD